ncbi:GGDEF domain-containing protein [Imhoffiella purpurea]|nr:GGDEF domain-containing protein [Imhoffiella purpurea]
MVARDSFDLDGTPSKRAGMAARERRAGGGGSRRPLTPADYDLPTGLINRRAFLDRLDETVKYHRSHRESFALLMLRLDDLDGTLALYGKAAAEHLVAKYAELLHTGVRSTDTVARIGDDRFAVILDGILDESNVVRVAQRIRQRLSKPIMTKGALIQASSDIGFALYPEDGIESSEILDRAEHSLDTAMEARIRKTPAAPGRGRLSSVG